MMLYWGIAPTYQLLPFRLPQVHTFEVWRLAMIAHFLSLAEVNFATYAHFHRPHIPFLIVGRLATRLLA